MNIMIYIYISYIISYHVIIISLSYPIISLSYHITIWYYTTILHISYRIINGHIIPYDMMLSYPGCSSDHPWTVPHDDPWRFCVWNILTGNRGEFSLWNRIYCIYIYTIYIYIIWLVVSNMNFIFHFIYGMSSFPLILTPSFFKMVIYCTSSYV